MSTENKTERAPVIVIVGHVDHGKSTLLDYIRKTKVAEGEAGGITQHISAYEATHKTDDGTEKQITFIDTPGHEAFQEMRSRGAKVADIAVLIVAADDGVMAQTKEALAAIEKAKIPYVVAITKIDKPNANVERVKTSLLEAGVYLEGLGGDIPYMPISSKTGEGVSELLDLVLLAAELEELTGDTSKDAEGVVIEAHRDPKKGVSATVIIKDGTLKAGNFVVAGGAYSPTRIMQDFTGKALVDPTFSSPVTIVGFSDVPEVGSPFTTVATKKEAETLALELKQQPQEVVIDTQDESVLPIIIKADTLGSLEAIQYELKKIKSERLQLKVIQSGVGAITEGDIKTAGNSNHALVIGFHVGIDSHAQEMARRMEIEIGKFDIIYKLCEWLEEEIVKRTPKIEVEEKRGEAKVLKTFSRVKDKQVLGARMNEGSLSVGDQVKIMRRGEEVGRGVVLGMQQQKVDTKTVEDGEFGGNIESRLEIAAGDMLEAFAVVIK